MATKPSKAMARNPLQDDDLMANTFYANEKDKATKATKAAKPAHYKICCISLYKDDIARLEEMVADLKDRGYTKANKSQLIRYALNTVDLDKMPKDI